MDSPNRWMTHEPRRAVAVVGTLMFSLLLQLIVPGRVLRIVEACPRRLGESRQRVLVEHRHAWSIEPVGRNL